MILAALAEAQRTGARLRPACAVIGISPRTIERWRQHPTRTDQRRGPRHRPGNALTKVEEGRVLAVMTSAEHGQLSPKQLVPRLADEGIYLASESTMYRLQRRWQLRRQRRQRASTHVTRASSVHRATGANQVWTWDITYLPTTVRGRFLYLYLVVDVWSRQIVGATIHAREGATEAAALIRQICEETGVDTRGLVLHADNGKPMRGNTMIATLQWLGIVPSFSRPHVCNDNPYSEALFRTLKQAPSYPRAPFVDRTAASQWVTRFVEWYNTEHRHSAIRFVTPTQRHTGHDVALLAARHTLYQQARQRRPERWTRHTRNWTPINTVLLNPPSTAEPCQ
ncbi:MAG: IS3 family transposase [Gemmatimonadaceae bacterium]